MDATPSPPELPPFHQAMLQMWLCGATYHRAINYPISWSAIYNAAQDVREQLGLPDDAVLRAFLLETGLAQDPKSFVAPVLAQARKPAPVRLQRIEFEILRRWMENPGLEALAAGLQIEPKTVQRYLSGIRATLGVSDDAKLRRYVRRYGLPPASPA